MMRNQTAKKMVPKALLALTILTVLLSLMAACGTAPSHTEPSSAAPGESSASVETAPESKPPRQTAAAAQTSAAEPAAPSADGTISLEEAKTIALEDAGCAQTEATFFTEQQDYEDGIAVYDIEFYTETQEYEYHIRMDNGNVYSKSVENHQAAADAGTGTQITEDDARAIALEHAGLSADTVSFRKTKLDRDNGQPIYELEFTKDGVIYEYEIHAETGEVIKFESESH